jgi:hypothetical protein
VTCAAAGRLASARTPGALAEACNALFANPPDRLQTRKHIEGFTWEKTSRDHLEVIALAVAEGPRVRQRES